MNEAGLVSKQSGAHRYKIDIEVCSECGVNVKIIACINDTRVVDEMLSYLDLTEDIIQPESVAIGLGPT